MILTMVVFLRSLWPFFRLTPRTPRIFMAFFFYVSFRFFWAWICAQFISSAWFMLHSRKSWVWKDCLWRRQFGYHQVSWNAILHDDQALVMLLQNYMLSCQTLFIWAFGKKSKECQINFFFVSWLMGVLSLHFSRKHISTLAPKFRRA